MSEPASSTASNVFRSQSASEKSKASSRSDDRPVSAEHPLDRLKAAQQQNTDSANQSTNQTEDQARTADQAARSAAANIPDDIRLEQSRVAPGMYKPVPEITVFQWMAPSRPFKKRDRQFFVTVTVIALLVSLILFFSGQFLPIAVVISVLFLMYVLQVIPPQEINHQLTTFGIKLEDNLYYWQEMGRFWFDKKFGQLLLNIETIRFPGRVTLVLPEKHRQEVKEILSEVLLEQKPELTTFEKISQWFQKKIPLE